MIKAGEIVSLFVEELESKSGNLFTVYRVKDGKNIRKVHFARDCKDLPKDNCKLRLLEVRPYSSEIPFGLYVSKFEIVKE